MYIPEENRPERIKSIRFNEQQSISQTRPGIRAPLPGEMKTRIEKSDSILKAVHSLATDSSVVLAKDSIESAIIIKDKIKDYFDKYTIGRGNNSIIIGKNTEQQLPTLPKRQPFILSKTLKIKVLKKT